MQFIGWIFLKVSPPFWNGEFWEILRKCYSFLSTVNTYALVTTVNPYGFLNTGSTPFQFSSDPFQNYEALVLLPLPLNAVEDLNSALCWSLLFQQLSHSQRHSSHNNGLIYEWWITRTIHASLVTWLWHLPYLVGNSTQELLKFLWFFFLSATDEVIQCLLMNEFSLVFSSKSNLCDGTRLLTHFHGLTPTNIQTWIVGLFATKHVLVIILKGFAWPWLCLRGTVPSCLLLESLPAHSLWILLSAEKRSAFPAAFGYCAFTARISFNS